MNSIRFERSRLRARRAMLIVSTILCSGLAAPAYAQAFRNLDANGVDLTLDDFVMAFNEGSIGSGEASLSLVRHDGSQRASQWELITLQRTVSGTNATIIIGREGHYSDTYTGSASGTSFTPAKADGSTLTRSGNVYTYASRDGMTITFSDPTGGTAGQSNFCNTSYAQASCNLLPAQIAAPSGSSTTLAWNITSGGGSPIAYSSALSSITNNYGYAITFAYDGSGNRTGATFSRGGTAQGSVSYAYPVSGITNVTDLTGQVWGITATSITDPRSQTALSVSGTTGVTSAFVGGVTTTYSRSVSGGTATMTVTNALSQTTTVVSDLSIGRPTASTNGLGKTTHLAYDGYGRLTTVTMPEGNYVSYTLDGRGNTTQTRNVSKSGSGSSDIITSASYDASCAYQVKCNAPNSVTDALGHATDFTYDTSTGAVLTVTAPAPTTGATRPQTRLSYTTASGVQQLTGTSTCITGSSCGGTSDEIKSAVAYDSYGNVTSIARGAGNTGGLTATTTMAYTAMGDVATVDGPLSGSGDTVYYRYDAARKLVGTTWPDPDGAGSLKRRAEQRTYAINGALKSTFSGTVNGTTDTDWTAFVTSQAVYENAPGFQTTYQRLADNSAISVYTQYSYDAVGRLQCVAQRFNYYIPKNLPATACVFGPDGADGPDHIVQFQYDAAGHLKERDSYTTTSTTSIDLRAAYTDNGQLATQTDANGNKTTYEYDDFDRLSKTRYPSPTAGAGTSSTTDYEQLVYDTNSNVTSHRLRGYAGSSTQHIDFTYDALGRLTFKDLPGAEPDVAYSYDNLGHLTGVTDAASNYVSFSYDALGRTTAETSPLGTMSYGYDLAGRRTQTTWPDSFYVNYDYLPTGVVSAIRENGATSGVGVLATYSYDDLGRRTGVTRGNGTTTSYSYDGVSRLSYLIHDLAGTSSDVRSDFSYNPAHQITQMTRSNDSYAWTAAANRNDASSINGLLQTTNVGAGSVGYDAKGNLSSTGSGSYAYSSENLLLAGPSATAAYDPLSRLYKTTGSATLFYGYDGAQRVSEYNSSGVMQRRYVFGPGDDEPLVWYEGSGTSDRRWLHADERGSVVAVSNASGASIGANSYDEYGVPASGNVGAFQYTGQTWLPDFGLYYYKARMYSSRLGRFMQTDSIGYDDGMNWYNYVGADPVNQSDPTGLDGDDIHDIIVTASRHMGFIDRHPSLSYVQTGSIFNTVSVGTKQCSNGANFSAECTGDIVVTARNGEWPSNGGPPLEGLRLGGLLRAPALGLIACILACKGPGVYAQILFGDLLKDSVLDKTLSKWITRNVGNRNFDNDWNYLAQNADRVFTAPNGNLVAVLQDFSVTRYVSSTGQGNTLFFNSSNMTPVKFRY